MKEGLCEDAKGGGRNGHVKGGLPVSYVKEGLMCERRTEGIHEERTSLHKGRTIRSVKDGLCEGRKS